MKNIILAILLIFLLFPKKVYGEMVFKFDGIESSPESIEYNQEIKLNFSFEDVNPPKVYYIEAAFKHIDGTRYFGWTKNDRGQWYQYEEDALANFFKFEINESSKSGSLFAKPDAENTYFKGSGKYFLKLYKITEGGSKEGSNAIEITIKGPPPTPTPTPTSTPVPTDAPQPTNTPTPLPPTSVPTSVPTAVPTVKPTSTPKPTLSLSPTPTGTFEGEVLAQTTEEQGSFQLSGGANIDESFGEEKPATVAASTNNRNLIFPAVAVVVGLAFIAFSVLSFWKSRQVVPILKL